MTTAPPDIAAAPRIRRKRDPKRVWHDAPPPLPRDVQAWRKRKKRPLPDHVLAGMARRAEQAKVANRIMREVSALRRKLNPTPPPEMGRVRGLPPPARMTAALVKRERAGRRAFRKRHAALGFTP